MKTYKCATINVFKYIEGDNIEKIIKAPDKKEACDKFRKWLEHRFFNYCPDIISFKEINVK